MIVRRSKLVLSAWQPRALRIAAQAKADALVLDARQPHRRHTTVEAEAFSILLGDTTKPPGLDVLLWVTKTDTESTLNSDLGLLIDGIVVSVQDVEEVHELDEILQTVERGKDLPSGKIQLDLVLNSARGVFQAYDLAAASPRVVSINLDEHNLAAEMGVAVSPTVDQFYYQRGRMIIEAARIANIQAHGLGFVAREPDAEVHLEEWARASRRMGLKGAFCWRPEDADLQNRGFAFTSDEEDLARAKLEGLEEAERRGLGAVNVRGLMVDVAGYRHIQNVLGWSEAIAQKEAAKMAGTR